MEQNIDFFVYPVLEATIPVPEWKNARITGIFPPWVSGPSFTIRKPPEKIYLLEDYVRNGQLSTEYYEIIVEYIKNKKNIIIAGSTGSGKTTLSNAIIQKKCELFPNDRYFIVQDVSELQCNTKYAEMIIIRADQAITAVALSLRYTPNCIIFGEVRKGSVMAELLDAWNTGHPGGITTMHSNSSALTITRIKKLLLDHYPGEASLPDLNEYIDLIIFIRQNKETGVIIDDVMEMKKRS
jgi:type IV secretion system protein VirB11